MGVSTRLASTTAGGARAVFRASEHRTGDQALARANLGQLWSNTAPSVDLTDPML